MSEDTTSFECESCGSELFVIETVKPFSSSKDLPLVVAINSADCSASYRAVDAPSYLKAK